MATQAEYLAAFGADLSGLEAGVKKAKDTLAKLGDGVPAKGIDSFVDKARTSLGKFGTDADRIGKSISIGLTLPLTLLGKQALTAGSSFESAFAGVRKTVDATEPELASLRQSFRDMAKEVPIAANEFARIGEAAGALGVKKEHILAFTRTMADLGVTTNLTSDQAANGLARLANIIANEAGPQYDRLGATLVALGNAGASTEAEILEMSLRIAGAGKVAGLSEADILSFANALSSVGIEAEAGGTAISRVFLQMNDAVKLGGKELQLFAQTAGMSAAQFKQAFETDAATAAVSFIEGLGRISESGKSLTPILKELELNEIRVRDALLRASGAGDLFRESLQLGSKAWQENSALTREAAERYKTFDSQVQLLKNQLTDVGITIFEQVRPALVSMVEGIKGAAEWVGKLDPQLVKMGVTAAAVFAASGPILVGIGKVSTALSALGTGAGGPIALAIIAVGALATAYSVNFGQMKNTLDDFVSNWSTSTTQTGKDWETFGSIVVKGLIYITQGIDTVITSVQSMALGVVAAATMAAQAIMGNLAGAAQTWKDHTAQVEKIWADHAQRLQDRAVDLERVGAAGAQALSEEFARKLDLNAPVQKELNQMRGPIRQQAQGVGVDLGKAIMFGWDSQTRRSPFFMIHDLMNVLIFAAEMPDKLGSHMAKVGKKAKQEFELGFAGFETFVDKIADKLINSPNSLDKVLAPSFKKIKQGAKEAFDEILDTVNKYLAAQGKANQVTGEQLFNLAKNHKEAAKNVIENAVAYEKLGGAIDTVNFERVAKEIPPVENEFKLMGRTIELSITTFEQLKKKTPEVIEGLTKLGFTFKTVFPASKELVVTFAESLKILEDSTKELAQQSATWVEQWSRQVNKGIDAADARFKKFGTDAPSYSNGIIEAAERIKRAIDDSIPLSIVKAQLAVQGSIDSMIGDFERMADYLDLSGDAWERYVEQNIRRELEKAKDLNKEAVDAIVEKWKKGLVTLPGIWNDIFSKASANTRKGVNDVLGIIDLIPGRVGDALRKAGSEFERWYTIIDKTIRLIERALGETETEGLSGVFNNLATTIGSFFKKAQAETKNQSETWADQVAKAMGGLGGESEEAGEDSGKSFSEGFLGKLGLIASGVATFFGSRGQGKVAGVIGGAAAGAQIGSAILPGWGTAIGAAAGAILGLFGAGGPSDEEKRRAEEDRRLQIEQLKQSLAKGYEELKQSILTTARDFIKFVDEMAGSAQIPKDVLNKFINNMTRTLLKLAEAMKSIAPKITDEVKKASENLLPAVELMSEMPKAFEAINQHMGLAEGQIDVYFQDFTILADRIGVLAEETPNKLEKQIKKFSTRMMPVAELLVTVSEGINVVLKTPPVSASQFQNWAGSISVILVEVSKLEQQFDGFAVRQAASFAQQAAKTTGFLKEGSEAIKSVVDIPTLTASDLAPFSTSVHSILTVITDLTNSVNSQLLVEARRFAEGAGASVTFILTSASAFKELEDMKEVMPDTLRSVGDGIKLAITVLAQIASEVDQKMRDDAEQLSVSIGSVFTVITNAAQAFTAASTTQSLYPATMRAIGDGIHLAIVELSRVNRSLDSGLVAEANTFAGSVTNIVSVIGSAGSAMRDLSPDQFATNGLIAVIGNIEEATRRTITLAKSIDKSDIALAVEFAISCQKIFEATAAGIEIQKAMANLEPISISQWDNWVLNVSQQTSALARAVDSTHQGMLLSAEFRSNTDVIKENVIGALSNILATANAAAGYLANSANFNSLIAPSALSASAFSAAGNSLQSSAFSSIGSGNQSFTSISTPAPFVGSPGGFASASRPTTVVNHFHVTIEGNVHTEREVEDLFYRALVKFERKGMVGSIQFVNT